MVNIKLTDLTLYIPGVQNYVIFRGAFPPTISAPSYPIFKMLVSICSSGPKEYTYKILSRSGKNYAFYGSSKKIGTRGRSDKGYIAKNSKWSESKNFFFQNYLQNMKLNNITKKIRFFTFLYEILSILVENCPKSADTLFLDPLATPPYESEVSRKNFIGSENGFEEFTENFKSIR